MRQHCRMGRTEVEGRPKQCKVPSITLSYSIHTNIKHNTFQYLGFCEAGSVLLLELKCLLVRTPVSNFLFWSILKSKRMENPGLDESTLT